MQARLQPLSPAAGSWTTRLLASPLAGGIRYNGPAQVLWSLTGIADRQLSGPIGIAADFSGRVQAPQFTGCRRANSLVFEDETYGTRITNLALQGRFTSSTFEITQLSGRAGSGTVTGRGTVGLASASGFPIDIRLNFDDAQLARGDALGATVSGEVAITNSRAGGALIAGDLRLPNVRYQIVRQGAAEVAELEGVRRKGEPLQRPGATQNADAAPSIWKLDLRLRADNQVFVSGMGLESEWQTDLRIRGTSTQPSMTGNARVIRGTFSFAGQRFEVTTGEVTFTGGETVNPRLNVAATGEVDDVEITLGISGNAFDPQIRFSSSPALPQDEIMARLLFGGSVTELSRFSSCSSARRSTRSERRRRRIEPARQAPLRNRDQPPQDPRRRRGNRPRHRAGGGLLHRQGRLSGDHHRRPRLHRDPARSRAVEEPQCSLAGGSFGSSSVNVRYRKRY
jgi:translocation and assembly module TamB